MMLRGKNVVVNLNSIWVKISVGFLVTLIPIVFLGYISQSLSSEALKEQAIRAITSTIHQTSKNIDDIVISVNELYKQIIIDSRYQNYLAKDFNTLNKYEQHKLNNAMEEILIEYAGTNVFVSQILVIIDEKKSLKVISKENIKIINETEWYKKAKIQNGKLLWMGRHRELDKAFLKGTDRWGSYYSMTAVGMSKWFPTNKKEGMLIFDINISSMRKILEGINMGTGSEIHIISPDGRDIYSDSLGNENIIGMQNTLAQYKYTSNIMNAEEMRGSSFVTYRGSKYLMVYEKVDDTGYVVVGLLPKSQLMVSAQKIKKLMYSLIIFIGLFVIIIGGILIPQSISKRINILIRKMIKVENGNLNINEVIKGNDEIGIIDKHFNKMVLKLKNLINDNYIKQLEKREAELNALQYQINPHFLYNTLESINSIASVYKCFEICEISEKLGNMFRYSISEETGDFVTLEREINHIKNYIDIQKLRFTKKFDVFYDINPSIKNVKVLKFILQPIVENAIQHGFLDNIELGFIEISAFKENDYLIIIVQDDGKGIKKQKLKEINKYINDMQEGVLVGYKKSIGIKNVNMRIKRAYGEQYGIVIKSEQSGGTQVMYKLPFLLF